MKAKNFNFSLYLLLTFIILFPNIISAQQDVITYNIPEFNKSGSFTIEYGSILPKITGTTNDTKNYIRLKDKTGKVELEITAAYLKKMKNKVDSLTVKFKDDKKTKYTNLKVKTIINVIDNLIVFLEDDSRFDKFKNSKKLKKQNSALSTIPWSYVLTTIRNLQTTIQGTRSN